MTDAMFLDDVEGLLHMDDPSVSGNDLLLSLDKDASKQALQPLVLDSAALDGLFSASDKSDDDKDHHSAATDSDSASTSSPPQCIPEADNIRSRDAIRRSTYRQKQKAHKEALYKQVNELSSQLSTLMKKKEAAKEGMSVTQAAVWKALANRNLQARMNAEEQRAKLQAAIKRRSTLIRDLGVLIRKRISEEALEDAGYAVKKPRTETPDRALYEAYIDELDEIYAKADSVFKASAVQPDLDSSEDTRLYYNPPRSSSKDANYHELAGSFSTPFAYERVREHVQEVTCMEFRPGFEVVEESWVPGDTTITKCRIEGQGGLLVAQHCVIRRFNEEGRLVLVWRKFSEGEGKFAGMHSDETGWSIIRPSRVSGSVSSVVELISRFVPITFSTATGSVDVAKQFADLMIKDGEEICQLGLQKLEKLLLDDALGVY
ncbi:hypothetical protein F442_13214 [Phytophthora nicotianae P10297]|uniref:START domain-containing protein n=2 Tax=Phytophthora nicotianae TaxID=4792 RepID=W2R4L5_PHYN3|nr:hypothetical protein PPTG_03363 [Phytophthora nicotianae INRA-310]ETN20337.1 hypothetical protein PPTG_03363 [Phytophthora nicotianae INRA-310]ETP39327.1 hypothetical protein F442_13214 [Phytophthora nicotianae P10297]